MYQIFVVEDELLIRQSIRNTIEMMQGPFSFCGEASDGEMALSIMQDLMPDILVTDIRMPFLDGFGLIRHAKSIMPWLKVIIISGYGDFEYARRAITLGVDQYLLKPVRSAELIRVIRETAGQIEKEKAAKALPAGFDETDVQNALRKHFMQQLLYGGTGTDVLLEQAGTLKLDIVRPCYQVCVCQFETGDQDHGQLYSIVRNALRDADQVLHYFNAADQLTFVLCADSEEDLNEQAYRILQILKHEVKDVSPVVTAVIGDPVQRIGFIAGSHKAAVDLLKYVSGIMAGQIVHMGDAGQLTADVIRFSGPLRKEFLQKLSAASASDVPALLRDMLEGEGGEQYRSRLMRYYTLVSLLKTAVQSTAERRDEKQDTDLADRLSAKYDVFTASIRYETFRETAGELLRLIVGSRQINVAGDKYAHVIAMAEAYVRENYCDPNISLISVAKHAGMSAAHFSTVFSQHEGRTFISYLTSLRMERAKELLTSTNARLADIALEIGYNEPNYFSHVFRKTVGITPKEYRNGGRPG
ncbi:MAG: helix-turn-helix domain-containing protein [Blautia sp.]|nr:helix-turn-helix domain-containing protein [Blautia sp.]